MPGHVYRMGSPKVPTSASGTSLTLSSAAAPLTALTLCGKSEQRTTTGAQLLDFASEADADSTQNGVTITNNRNGSFTANGTPTVTEGYVFTFYLARNVTLSDGTYRANTGVRILRKDGTDGYANMFFTFNSETDEAIDLYYQKSVQNYVDGKTIWPMLNSGTTALPWEPYTGGAPSPSPDYPQEIKSVGDSGTINVSLSDGGSQSQTLPVQTPNGLPGIPVSSGGNYTDESGQQWICDEVDFKRGVYVQRVGKYNFEQGKTVRKNLIASTESLSRCYFSLPGKKINGTSAFTPFFCNIFKNEIGIAVNSLPENTCIWESSENIYICVASSWGDETQISQKLYDLGAKFVYLLENPIETPLSPADLAAYSALRTYSPTTVVTNDAGAWMKVGYYSYGAIERLVRWAESAERK